MSQDSCILGEILKNKDILEKYDIKIDKELIDSIEASYRGNNFIISVLGSMKSGKSTFINALLGKDLMPNENAACTLTTTEISNYNCNSLEIIKKYENGITEVIGGDDLIEKFHRDVKKSRINKTTNFKYTLKNNFRFLNEIDESRNIKIVDTPGLNEMDGLGIDKNEIHRIFDKQLKCSNYIIFIIDYKYYKSEENMEILRKINSIRPDLINLNRVLFLINKIDLITYKDGTVNDVSSDVHKMLSYIGISKPLINTVSSKKALFSRLIESKCNLEQYKEDLDNFRPLVDKVIDGETYSMLMPLNEVQTLLIKESNIINIEDYIKFFVCYNCDNQIEESLKFIETDIRKKTLSFIQKAIKENEDNVIEIQGKLKASQDRVNAVNNYTKEIDKAIKEINNICRIPSKEDVKKNEFYQVEYIHSEYIYPYCDIDEYYSFDSTAESAAKEKFRSWRSTIKMDYEEVQDYYLRKLTYQKNDKNFFYKTNMDISEILDSLDKSIAELSIGTNFYTTKINSRINIYPDPIMNITYDNTEYFDSDNYDNSTFVELDYEETYVSGFFGEKLKTVVVYNLDKAIEEEEKDRLRNINMSSEAFFNDYYEKKYMDFLHNVSVLALAEIDKAKNAFNLIINQLNDEKINEEKSELEDYKNLINIKELLLNI